MAEAKAKQPPTRYTILQRVRLLGGTKFDDVYDSSALDASLFQDGVWVPVGEASTRGKTAAIKTVVRERAGDFRAVPTSSWKGGLSKTQQTIDKTEALDD